MSQRESAQAVQSAFNALINSLWSRSWRRHKVESEHHRRRSHAHRVAGLAISGGVDSMALASLYSHAKQTCSIPETSRCYAFIVDHGFRPDSKEETRFVANEVRKLHNMTPVILKLNWDHLGGDPTLVPNFESTARKLRYKALGKACRERNIEQLFLGHHRDDQAETILQRIHLKYMGHGLSGMNTMTSIPENHGVYGVKDSGRPFGGGPGWRRRRILIEGGGVQIVRPLLSFPKKDLTKVCMHRNVRWFEDESNKDVTLASRNTIRQLQQGTDLPVALRTDRIMQVALTRQEYAAKIDVAAQKLLDDSSFVLDVRHGRVKFKTPGPRGLNLTEDELYSARARMLTKIIQLVSPVGQATNWDGRIHDIMNMVFFQDKTHGSIQFMETSILRDQKEGFLVHRKRDHTDSTGLPMEMPWLLDKDGIWDTEWQLFDGRYWLRVQRKAAEKPVQQIRAKFLTEKDIEQILPAHNSKRLVKKWRGEGVAVEGKPGFEELGNWKTSSLLNVVALEMKTPGSKAEVVVMPSFGLQGDGWRRADLDSAEDGDQEGWKWDVRFKKLELNLELHRLIDMGTKYSTKAENSGVVRFT